LEELAKSYNPNYQDMAVKAAVVGFEELTKAPEGGESEKREGGEEVEEEIGDGELDELERKDLEALLLMDEGDMVETDEGSGMREFRSRRSLLRDSNGDAQCTGSTSISRTRYTILGKVCAIMPSIGWSALAS